MEVPPNVRLAKAMIGAGLKQCAKTLARQTLGRIPPPKGRLEGKLAGCGGAPVRDVRLRPWPSYPQTGMGQWLGGIQPAFRKIFRDGVEGLPQPIAKDFARRWAEFCGCRFGLLLGHGTDALRIGLAAALDHDGLDYGGEIIVPNLSFIASATAALDRRVGVAFVDVDPKTLLIDPASVEAAIIPGKTRAIMAVHLFGQPADMAALDSIATRHGLKVIEDAAQAHGSALESGPAGSFGAVAGFSFQSFKNLTCGEGGALTTNDEALFERAYSMHNVGRETSGPNRWEHVRLGWNCRITEYQAALLRHRFQHLGNEQETRQRNFAVLREMLGETRCVEPLGVRGDVRKHGAHMFVMRYRQENCGGLPIDQFLESCGAEGVPISRGYAHTMSNQPVMKTLLARHSDYVRVTPTPVADAAVRELIYLPQNVFLGTESDMMEIAAGIRKVERHYAAQRDSSKLPQ